MIKVPTKVNRKASATALVALVAVTVFTSDFLNLSSPSRFLTVDPEDTHHRRLTPCRFAISTEDFEGADPLDGWTHGLISSESEWNYSKFLGRYGPTSPSPKKTYDIPVDADAFLIELDLYEIGSWGGDDGKGTIYLNDEEIWLSAFTSSRTIDRDIDAISTTASGVEWSIKDMGSASHLGFNTRYFDKMHKIILMVPQSSGHFDDGKLTMKMVVTFSQYANNQSAGWDNIKTSYVMDCTDPPTPSPVDTATKNKSGIGVNVDPLIMGLQGQLFRFEGRAGAWYSAISTPSFQWNTRISKFDGCPKKSDSFCSGAAFSFFDSEKRQTRTIEINIVNEKHVHLGCSSATQNCLGDGSLEILIDGTRVVSAGDYQFVNGSGRVLAFNTFHQCSRKWFNIDLVQPPAQHRALRTNSQQLPGVYDVIGDLSDTMVDTQVCQQWIDERKKLGDLFDQAGHYSTIIVNTEAIQFYIEYKQEHERCNAHSLDVWMSKVSPIMLSETWEGIIGETKAPTDDKQQMYDQQEILKFANDADYQVGSSFSTRCNGCSHT